MLRPYQDVLVKRVLETLSGDESEGVSALMEAPTGAGKTTIASALTTIQTKQGKRVYFVVDTLELIDQTLERFTLDGLTCGVIQGDHWAFNAAANVQICSIQTLRNRWADIPVALRPDWLIVDEAHVIHKAHEEIIRWCLANGCRVLGLSATPYRAGLGQLFQTLITEINTRQLIEQGYLSPYSVFAPSTPDFKGVKTRGGDYATDDLERVMGDKKIVGDIIDTWVRRASNRRTLVFVPTRANSRQLCDEFQNIGVEAAHVDGSTPKAERFQIINDFRTGKIQVLCNVAVLTKGFDAPEVDCVVFARPTKSLALYRQMVGRGLRTAPGKDNCLILDHSGNVHECGMPDEPLELSLDMGDITRSHSRPGEKAKVACEACGFVTSKVVCPVCEFERQSMMLPDKRLKLKTVEGELVYMATETSPDEADMRSISPAELYAMALWHCRVKGFKDGWAYFFFKGVMKQEPPKGVYSPVQPNEVAAGLLKYWTIKQAKERKKERRNGR